MSNNIKLTEGERKKIDENRKKALALKAQKRTFSSTATHQAGCSNIKDIQKANIFAASHGNRQVVSPQKFALPKDKSSSAPSYNNYNGGKTSFQTAQKSNENKNQSIEFSKDRFYGLPEKIIKGKCVLISQDRFNVEVSYHGPLIEYFKQMETRSYNTASRIWSFQLKEYNKFTKGVSNFQPEIVIEPLPPVIIQTFSADDDDNWSKEVDLSRVDNILVSALMPFQKESVYFALHRGGRVLLADGMGLGKTLQALSIARYYRSEWPVLIVTPSSVRYDWAQQIYKWLPSVDPQEVNIVDSYKGNVNVKEGLITIMSYDLMSKKIQELKERRFQVVIMDESHFLKNAKAIRTKAATSISKLAKRLVLLSGTPALSRPSELFTQIISICPRVFKFHDFGLRYCAAKQLPWGWDYSGASNLEELQLLLEKKIMIRRQKSDVLPQLPDKTRQVVVLNPVLVTCNKSLNQAGKIMDKPSLKGLDRRGALLQYFHETSKAKLKAVRDFILHLIESDKKFLVFAHHQEMMDCIEDAILEQTKIKHIRIDGSTKPELRSQLCKEFQSHEDCKVAVLSILAANAGLNLSAANLVVFAELFWNPGILVQAEDRVHRIGQKNAVLVQYLVAKRTADDFIWPLVQEKLSVLTKAGLTADCFSDADTMHVVDKKSDIMEMFKQNFLDENLPTSFDGHKEETEGLSEGPRDRDSSQVTPVKRKRQRSSSCSPSSKLIPKSSPDSSKKRQLQITNYFQPSPEKGGSHSKKEDSVGANSDEIKCRLRCDEESRSEYNYNKIEESSFENGVDKSAKTRLPVDSNTTGTVTNSEMVSLEDYEALKNYSWDEEF